MSCKNPYIDKTNVPRPCGKCVLCRVRLARMWQARMSMELSYHPFSSFITLTYNDESLPENGSLSKRDLQLFWKRLRRSLPPDHKIRFYACGEYGERTGRAHYHAIVFNLWPEHWPLVEKSWCDPDSGLPMGKTLCSIANESRICYVTKYVTKGLIFKEHRDLPKGCIPEFSAKSSQPGIGLVAVADLVNAYKTRGGQTLIDRNGGDVLSYVAEGNPGKGGHYKTLGPYFKKRLRKELGIPFNYESPKYLAWVAQQQKVIADALRDSSEDWHNWPENGRKMIDLKKSAIVAATQHEDFVTEYLVRKFSVGRKKDF